jgi:hypothetical protein
MTITAAVDTPELGGYPVDPGYASTFIMADGWTKAYAGTMAMLTTATVKVAEAADTSGNIVLGRVEQTVDNADTDQYVTIRPGIFRYVNDSSYPVTRAYIGQPCYVKDGKTVTLTAGSTNNISAGLVYDVDADGVWVDQRVAALGAAFALRA